MSHLIAFLAGWIVGVIVHEMRKQYLAGQSLGKEE